MVRVPMRCNQGKCVLACVCMCVKGGCPCGDGAHPWGFQRDRCGRSASWGAAGSPAGRPCVLCPFFSLVSLWPHALLTAFLSAPSSPHPPPPRLSLSPSPVHLVSSSSCPPSVSPPGPPPPALFTLQHPAMQHSVPAIRLPFHLCLLPLRGGCDPRNISEGEEGESRSRAERDRLGRRSERGSLLQPGQGGGLVCLSGPRFKSCLSLTAAG